MNAEGYHIPVLLQASMEGLNIRPDGTYVDLTYGGGGHSKAILERLSDSGHLYGFDQDEDAMQGAVEDARFTFVRSNFRFLKNWMQYYGVEQVDGILADLGVSSHHFDTESRGFSFRFDAPLDMRMNQRASLTAQKVLQDYTEEQLANIFYLYGEMKNSRRIAAAIVKRRDTQPLQTTGELVETLKPYIQRGREKKDMAKLFQALRIEVNGEMKALQQMLKAAVEILRTGGRLVVLTYHSLEDRLVKNMIHAGNVEGNAETNIYGHTLSPLKSVGRNYIAPDEEEQTANPRSRSAKLRVAERTNIE